MYLSSIFLSFETEFGFLREADKRTEKYSRLLDKYMAHPDRDTIIAKEMGWDHLLEEMDEEYDEPDGVSDFFVDEIDEVEGRIADPFSKAGADALYCELPGVCNDRLRFS